MAVELQTGVPWVMCKQSDAPDPVVSFTLLAKGIKVSAQVRNVVHHLF